jgi:CheY-like chemotaxis protein
MARKSALVVDDSKSARVILSRMLEKYDIEVDMAESAEQAIEYLKNNRPDAIFMDHLMPGMDGLQAVKAIKGNPQTAMIPIMMYTSQEGELYVGQARALGAMGVLPKQVRPVDVSKVLYELHLLPDRRDMAEPALHPVEIDLGLAVERTPSRPAGSGPIDWGRRLETAVKDQGVDIRRFIVASLDSFSTRIISDLRNSMPIQGTDPIAPPPPPPKPPWPWIAGILGASLIAVAFAASWVATRNELTGVRAELGGLKSANAELQRSRLDLDATVKDLTAALAANTASQSTSPSGAGATSGSSAHIEPVPYGEIAFDRSRLEVLRDLLVKLEAQGFHGTVKITSSGGMYCLTGNATDGYAPAAATLPVSRCDLVGNPLDDALSGQQRQSLAFANLVAAARQRTAGAITVTLASTGTAHPTTPYPGRTESVTAGDWNKVAAANNRVEFSVEPVTPPQ